MKLPLKLKDLGDIGNVIAAIGVIVSLLIVAAQIRENTNALNADARLQMVDLGNQSFGVRDPAFTEMLLRAEDDSRAMNPVEYRQFFGYAIGIFNMWEQGFFLHRDGLMEDDVWSAWNAGMTEATRPEAYQEIWQASAGFYSAEFRSYVEQLRIPR